MASDGAQPLSFEEAFRQLMEIAEGMEKGGLTLGEATARFEHGMKLVQYCNHLLDAAELEITELRENYQRPSAPAARPAAFDASFNYPAEDEGFYEGEEENLPF